MQNLLTRLEHIGHTIVPKDFNREQLALHLGALRAAGHAIMADEVISHGDVTGVINVMHYRTCKVCHEKEHHGKISEVKG